MLHSITLFTDGACHGNPGPGGWAYILRHDSEDAAKGIHDWPPKGKARGWSRSATQHKPPENRDLWQKIDDLLAQHEVHAQHVYGHAGHPENEQCDRLAVAAYQ